MKFQDITKCANDLAAKGVGATDEGAAVYGLSQTIPDRSIVGEIAATFIETILDTNKGFETEKERYNKLYQEYKCTIQKKLL